MKKKYIVYVIIAIIVIIAAALYIMRQDTKKPEVIGKERLNELSNNTEIADYVTKLEELSAATFTDEEAVGYYIQLGFAWYEVAQRTGEENDYNNAIAAYQKADEYANYKNIIPINNIGNIYDILGRYDLAEQQYLKSYGVSKVEFDTVKKLVDLYRYKKVEKNPEEVLKILDDSINLAVDKATLLQLKAGYLRDLGRTTEALEIYKLLAKDYPQFEQLVQELEAQK